MSSVDNRIVNMEFNNRDFANKIAETLMALQKLDNSLKFKDGQAGLQNVANAANKLSFGGMESGIASLERRFSTLGIIGMTAIQNITNGIMGLAKTIGSKIISGGITRAMGLEHAQFMLEGIVKDSAEEARIMDDVRDSVDGTAYSLDQAANVAAQFAATGMRSGKEMQTVLKGVTGIASVFGADYQRVGQIFTQVSAQGRVYANDLLQLSSMGVNARAALVDFYTEVKHRSDVTMESIDDMVRKGKVDFETFGKAMSYAFGDQAKEANRTFTGAMSNVNAHLAMIGAEFIEPFVATKDAEEGVASQTYNLIDVLNTFRGVIDNVKGILAEKGIFDNWAKGVGKASEVLTKFLDIFSNSDVSLEKRLESFRKSIGMSKTDFGNLLDTFNGIKALFQNVGNIVGSFVKAILPAGKGIKGLGSGILAITGAFGRYQMGAKKAIQTTKEYTTIFDRISNVVSSASKSISGFTDGILGKFIKTGDKAKKSGEGITKLGDSVKSVGDKFGGAKDAFSGATDTITKSLTKLGNVLKKVFSGEGYKTLIDFLSLGISGSIGLSLTSLINGTSKSLKNLSKSIGNTSATLNINIKALDQMVPSITKTLSAFQKNIKAGTLLKISEAIAILAGSIFLLSTIKPERLVISLGAIQALIVDIIAMSKKLTELSENESFKGMLGMIALSKALMSIAGALILMSFAVKILSTMSVEELVKGLSSVMILLMGIEKFLSGAQSLNGRSLKKIGSALMRISAGLLILSFAVSKLASLSLVELAKGLGGIAILLTELAIFMKLTNKLGSGIGKGAGLILMAASLLIISKVIKDIGKLKPEQLSKGLTGLGFVLLEIAAFIKLISGAKGILLAAAGLLILSKALQGFTDAIGVLGGMSEEQLAKGLLGLGASLVVIAGAMYLMPKNMAVIAAGLVTAAKAISLLATSMSSIGGMSSTEIAKSLIGMAGALVILAAAMHAMNGAITGAAAMLIVGAAIAILVPSLMALGSMSIESIAKSLLALAGAFAVIGVASLVLAPMTVAIIALGVAMALVGVGMLAFGAGIMAVVSAVLLLVTNIDIIAASLPKIATMLMTCSPMFGTAATNIVKSFVSGLGPIVTDIAKVAVQAIGKFISMVAAKIPDIIDAAMDLAVNFINGLADGLTAHAPELIAAISNLMGSVINFVLEGLKQIVSNIPIVGDQIAKGIEGTQKEVSKFFGDGKVKSEVSKGAKETTKAVDKETKNAAKVSKKNLDNIPKSVKNAMKNSGKSFDTLPKELQKSMKKVGQDKTLEKESGKVGKKGGEKLGKEFANAAKKSDGKKAGEKVADGAKGVSMSGSANNMYNGFANSFLAHDWYGKGADAARKVNKGFKDTVQEHSPSKLWGKYAEFLYVGFANRMRQFDTKFYSTGVASAKDVNTGFKSTMNLMSNIDLSSISQPVIRPVMDLSDVKMGVDSISSMFNANQYALGIASGIQGTGVNSVRDITNNINMTVNGADDPKAWANEFAQELIVQARS